jgi:hypothetical protein
MNNEQLDTERTTFEAWWHASKYMQVVLSKYSTKQTAWDAWQAARSQPAKSPETRFEEYVASLIAKSPDVRELGERLALWLDDDKFNTIEPILTGIAKKLSQPAEAKDDDVCRKCGGHLDTGFECNDCGKLQKPDALRVTSDEAVERACIATFKHLKMNWSNTSEPKKIDWRATMRVAIESISPAKLPWQPIDTAPKDNKRPLYLARIVGDELKELDFNGSWESESESWEMPEIYHYWASENGIEYPTHWAYQDDPVPLLQPVQQGIELPEGYGPPEGYELNEHLAGIWQYELQENGQRLASATSWNSPILACIAAWQDKVASLDPTKPDQQPVATVLLPDPEDERDGVRFSLADWDRLNKLPAKTKLYVTPQPWQRAVPVETLECLMRVEYQDVSTITKELQKLIASTNGKTTP